MRALLGLVKVDIHPHIKDQRQDENHMGDSTPTRRPATSRPQPKSSPIIYDAKSGNLVARVAIASSVTLDRVTILPYLVCQRFGDVDPAERDVKAATNWAQKL
jgi:hypothetical protein